MKRRVVAVVCAKDGLDLLPRACPNRLYCPSCHNLIKQETIDEIDYINDLLASKELRKQEWFDANALFKKIEKLGVRLMIKYV